MNGILDAAVEVDKICREQRLPYCIIGGIALQRWGEPRTTLDVDITVYTGFGNEQPVIERLLTVFRTRVPDAAEFALQSRVVLAQTELGVGVDVSLGALGFEQRTIERSSIWQIDSVRQLRTCCAEDLLVHKAFANRGQDWVDIAGIIIRQANLDRRLIREELTPLLEVAEDPTILDRLNTLLPP